MALCYQLELFRSSDSRVRKEAVSISSTVSDTEPTSSSDSSNSRPSTVADLKETIQKSFNIPKPEGDIIRVCYDHEGDCKGIIDTIDWLKKLDSILKENFPITARVKDHMGHGLQNQVLTKLAINYFYPWFESRTYVNKLHFIALSGFDTMVSILDIILRERWDKMERYAQVIVTNVLHSLWNMCESVDIKKMLLAHSHFIGLCLKCFTLNRLENLMNNQSSVLLSIVHNSLGILCK